MPLVILKRGGQPGNVAINTDLVTYVRSASGPFTDVHFGEHHVSVEGTFDYVVGKLNGDPAAGMQPPVRNWIKTG